MGNLLYVIAVILIILWLIGYFGGGLTGLNLNGNGLIHILLILAIIVVLIRVIRGEDPFR